MLRPESRLQRWYALGSVRKLTLGGAGLAAGIVFMLLTIMTFPAYGLFAASLQPPVIAMPGGLLWMRRSFAAAFVAPSRRTQDAIRLLDSIQERGGVGRPVGTARDRRWSTGAVLASVGGRLGASPATEGGGGTGSRGSTPIGALVLQPPRLSPVRRRAGTAMRMRMLGLRGEG